MILKISRTSEVYQNWTLERTEETLSFSTKGGKQSVPTWKISLCTVYTIKWINPAKSMV